MPGNTHLRGAQRDLPPPYGAPGGIKGIVLIVHVLEHARGHLVAPAALDGPDEERVQRDHHKERQHEHPAWFVCTYVGATLYSTWLL